MRTFVSRLRGSDGLDKTLGLTVAALLVASVLTSGLFGFHIHFLSPGLDLVIDTTTTVVTLSVAALAWARFGETNESIGLFQAASFLVAATANAFSLLIVLDQIDPVLGVAEIAPGEATLYVSTMARIFAASLLVVGGLSSFRRAGARQPLLTLATPAVVFIAAIGLLHAIGQNLPPLSSSFAVGTIALGGPPNLPESTAFGAAVQILGGILFLGGAGVSRRLFRREGRVVDAYITVGLLFAAFSQFHLALYPGTYPGLITSGDLLALAFDMVLLLGIEAEARSTLLGLRQANRSLELLRDSEAERASLEERARLSRELHDGLAQDLWLAKLKSGRLAALPHLGPEALALSAELGKAIDAGLAEARQAVIALRHDGSQKTALPELVRGYVEDFSDRFGLSATFECDGEIPPTGLRARAELLRIVQEALSNVSRHADATMVRVRMSSTDGHLTVAVRDNGRGFDLQGIESGGFGLTSMRERAELVGGRLTIESQPSGGTTVTVALPLTSQPAHSTLS